MSARRLAIAVLAAALFVPGPRPAAGGESRALGDVRWLEDAYYEHLMRDRPDLATRAGQHGAESMLVPVTEASILEDDEALSDLEARIARIDRAALEPDGLARLDSLVARVARERAPYLAGAWRTDPAAYFDLAPGAVLDVATLPGTSPCTRARHAERRMRVVPEVLRAASVNLEHSVPSADKDDAAPWLAAVDSLRALPDRLAGCKDSQRQAGLIEADSLAIRAIERFVRFLRDERVAGN
jgi:hypothetical protein